MEAGEGRGENEEVGAGPIIVVWRKANKWPGPFGCRRDRQDR